jgi:hypothetical protein
MGNGGVMRPPFGAVILRHVSSSLTDLYWKRAYKAIRRFHPEMPVMIVDDSSDRQFLQEDVFLTNCTVIYDHDHKGRGELLPYLYFHLLKPFDRAIILHDSAFLQAPVACELQGQEGIQFLWTIPHIYDDALQKEIHELLDALPEVEKEPIRSMYRHTKANWTGAFGVMSIVDGEWLDEVVQRYDLFNRWLPIIKNRQYRCALERVFGLVAYYHLRTRVRPPMFGRIQDYIRWGVSFMEYVTNEETYQKYPVMKVWSGR